MPIEGEAFADTLKRAIEYGKSLTPEQLEQQRKADLKVAPMVAASAPVIGASGAAALAGAGSAAGSAADLAAKLTARSVATSSLGTGILDAAGNEVMRDVTTYGPSLLRQFGSKAIPWVMRAAGLGGISYEVLKHLVNIAKD